MRPLFRSAFLWIAVALILVASCIAASFWWANRPETLFRRIVFDPIPASVKILNVDYVSRREWQAIFHVQLSPTDFEFLRAVKAYRQLESDSDKHAVGLIYPLFKTMLPTESALANYEVFQAFDDHPQGTLSYFIIDRRHSDGFIIYIRF